MKRFVEGEDRSQTTLFPERLDDYIAEDNPVRFIDAFIDQLPLLKLGFGGVEPSDTGRPAYHPSVLLKIYVYGYLNRIHSSRRLERETQRNVELMWLTGRLMPDFKTCYVLPCVCVDLQTRRSFRDISPAVMGVNRMIRKVFVLCLMYSGAANALNASQLTELTQAVVQMCRGGTLQGEASKINVLVTAKGQILIVKNLLEGGADAKVEVSKEQWNGIKALIDAEDYTGCVERTQELLLPGISAGSTR